MFKGGHVPPEVIIETVRYYLAYKLSYRDIEETQRERGVNIDHATINCWVIKFTPILEHAKPNGIFAMKELSQHQREFVEPVKANPYYKAKSVSYLLMI